MRRSYVEPGATASDDYCITDPVTIGGDVVDTGTPGTYYVTYDVSDCAGNPAVQVTRTVNVVDTTAPTIILLGDNPMTVECGDPYVEPGATYYVTYDVSDCAGNPADHIVRTVNVVAASSWTVPMVADAGVEGINADLEFGIHPDATDEFDSGIDLPSPPPGPGALFEAYFSIVHPLFSRLNKDFRGEIPNEWTLEVKSTDQDIELTWDATAIPSELPALMDTGIEKINMKTQSSVVLSAGEYSITISVGEVEIQLSLKAGWNMVSVPVVPIDDSPSAVFPGVAGIFTWDATSRSYYVPTVIEPEKGYWVAVTEDTTIIISGTPIDTWTNDIRAGWNMIGSVITVVSIADPNDAPDGSVITPAYWWDPVSKSYILTTDIEPGKGYWAASVNDCTLTL
jgi:hypothetical protein